MDNIRYQVFVSSTYEDLVEERKQVTQAILESDCFPAGMELFPASNESQWDFIKQVIDESDIYLIIIAGRYGSINEDKNISYTEMEFDYAMSTKKPIIVLIHSNISDLPIKNVEATDKGRELLKAFTEKTKRGRLVKFWSNKDNIKSAVLSSLNQIKGRLPNCGWIKYNDTLVFSDEQLSIKNQELLIKNQELTNLLNETNKKNIELDKALASSKKELKRLQKENLAVKKEYAVHNTETLNKELCEAQTKCEKLSKELKTNKLAYSRLKKEVAILRDQASAKTVEPINLELKKTKETHPSIKQKPNCNLSGKEYKLSDIDNSIWFWYYFSAFLKHNKETDDKSFHAALSKMSYYTKDDRLVVFFNIFHSCENWMRVYELSKEVNMHIWKENALDQSFIRHCANIMPSSISEYEKGNIDKLQTKMAGFFSLYFYLIRSNGTVSNHATDICRYKKMMDSKCYELVSLVFKAHIDGYL